MPRVHTQRAAKDYPEHGIEKGDLYYKWSFYRQRPQMSKTPPRRSQLTQREELAAIYDAEDQARAIDWSFENKDAIASELDNLVECVGEARDLANEKAENIREYFQESEQAEELENFACECDDLLCEIENTQSELEEVDAETFDSLGSPENWSFPDI